MTRYKSGDRVVVRRDLSCDKKYDGFSVVPDMTKLSGKIVTIIRVDEWSNDEVSYRYYRINESEYNWTDSMFESQVNRTNAVNNEEKLRLKNNSDAFFDMLGG